ncbi:efflux RND transporter periplasmic adaptor subunit [Stieleria sp. JC731]|uniref:efflux RND transporter periplasmic adaptor subunit n=1 Tax=Pirellulaceae TaxID=2691357 RepID=UPI001E471FD4|nr:efflux RND transporter periplasmic adaptor subunit [Stieleria sp. JC731]MCC9601077.1 efflux RND transporter periplasmic adaptor subunit [Stieleria sp. JC731]
MSTNHTSGVRQFANLGKWLVLAVLIGAGIYWYRFMPVPVQPHEIAAGSVTEEVMGTGTLEARISATISPKISGRIAKVLADQGDSVFKGDELVRLDDDELRQQVAIAQANVDAAKAAIERLKIDKQRANIVLTQAQKNLNRIQSLRKSDASSQDELDRASETLGLAMADVSRSEAGINEGQKELISAEKNLEYQEARLRDTIIVAPFSGLVVKRSREPGDVVVPGSAMMTLIATDELWISAWVDETQMSKLQTGQSSRVVFRSQPEHSFPAKVTRMGREADRETREFIVDVGVLELPKNWAVGQRAEAYIKIAEPQSVPVVPKSFLVKRDGADGVFVNLNGVATWRVVSLGVRGTETIEVIDGLSMGDVVIKPGNERGTLKPGLRVVTQ